MVPYSYGPFDDTRPNRERNAGLVLRQDVGASPHFLPSGPRVLSG